MTIAIHSIAAYAYSTGARGLFVISLLILTGCAPPGASLRPSVYDFGPGRLTPAASATPMPVTPPAPPAPLIVAEIESSPALDSTAVLYRLRYADAQQLKAYAQARWSMPPTQLLRQRLREHLGQHHALLSPGDTRLASVTPSQNSGTSAPLTLHLALEEFSQLFDAPNTSVGLLRLHATVTQAQPSGEKWLAQHTFTVQHPAPSADAPGGVRALTVATDAALQELDDWLHALAL